MYTEIQKVQLISQLTQACAALLVIEMDEEDRQIIFQHIKVVIDRIQTLVRDSQNGV